MLSPNQQNRMTPEDWQLYAAHFFPHSLPAHREAMVRELFKSALGSSLSDLGPAPDAKR